MDNAQERIEKLEEQVLDLSCSNRANQTMIGILLKFIEFKHGSSARAAISDGLSEAITKNHNIDDSEESMQLKIFSEKLKEFI